MGIHAIKLPDVGEGVAEAELVEWPVAVGDLVRVDEVIAVVMTDKASVEIPTPVEGIIAWLGGEIGDTLAVGSDLIRIEVEGDGNTAASQTQSAATNEPPETERLAHVKERQPRPDISSPTSLLPSATVRQAAPRRAEGEKPLAAPSVRKRARDAGIDLRTVVGSGPAGRILHDDVEAYLTNGGGAAPAKSGGRSKNTAVREVKVVGLRRRIAEKMALAKAKIPHIAIVEEIDMTNLEDLRKELNETHTDTRPKLTLLPFVIRAIVEAAREQPEINAHFDDDAGIITEFGGIHVGVAAQTPNGLMVPVVRHAEANSLWDNAAEVSRLAEAARDATASRDELSGSTITITSLGPLGAIATTPIINHPEVAIVGINKMQVRPHWDGQQFVPRKMMNISCSFDHRVIDGYVAAVFVAKLKSMLEKPAMLFVERWHND
ncbi:MAG: 2-oxoisovalerate dehydrogenase E2 component (dihydrolipoyl transacylase) [Hyphomicrobiaceae bacterium]|jgi:2-oxoisovalerate dehydrogenase E2 component (dihydrolipoyl transacylase)